MAMESLHDNVDAAPLSVDLGIHHLSVQAAMEKPE